MQDASAGSQHPSTAGYSLQEAASLLGIGVNTLRRRIAAGQIRAEQVQRPQGHVWRVYLEGQHPPIDPTSQQADQEAPRSLPHPPTALAQAEALTGLVQATVATVLGPLVAELAASRQTNERQAERMAELERENGRLTERLALAAPAETPQEARTAPEAAEPMSDTRNWRTVRSWWPILAIGLPWLVLAAVVAWLR